MRSRILVIIIRAAPIRRAAIQIQILQVTIVLPQTTRLPTQTQIRAAGVTQAGEINNMKIYRTV